MASGFKHLIIKGLKVDVGSTLTHDLNLEVGGTFPEEYTRPAASLNIIIGKILAQGRKEILKSAVAVRSDASAIRVAVAEHTDQLPALVE